MEADPRFPVGRPPCWSASAPPQLVWTCTSTAFPRTACAGCSAAPRPSRPASGAATRDGP